MSNSYISNRELAEIFERIAALLEIKGEVIYKIRAYQKAAESLRSLGEDAARMSAEDRLNDIPGVGKAIAEKIQEIVSTGRLKFLDRLEEEVPPGLTELLQVPDLGPRKAALFWKQAGVTNLTELETAAKDGRLRDLPGMGERSEQRIIEGIAALGRRTGRMLIDTARNHATHWLEWLRAQPGVQEVEMAGSLRRWRETVGDLDLVAACEEDCPVLENFTEHPEVERVLGQGENKASVELKSGVRIQVWITTPERFGSLLLYATGSKGHNVRLREMALKQGLSLSDRGMQAEDGDLQAFSDESSLYAVLGLPWIPPELREDRGEIEAGLKKRLPKLVQPGDIRAELHAHTTWSDGTHSIEGMALAAQAAGFATLAITDHSAYMGITGGVRAETLPAQRAEIDQARAALDPDFTLLHGVEVDITASGELALPDEALEGLDLVIASLHVSLRQPRPVITERLLKAIRNPHVDVIAHPSGRLLPNREGADLDWDTVLEAARKHGVALEINASPSRLDLDDVYARRAVEMGIPLMINTDAHTPGNFALMVYGVGTARRAWAEPKHVINTWDGSKIIEWLRGRK